MKSITYNFFLILFSTIPFSMVVGPTISLINILLIDVFFIFIILRYKDYTFVFNKYLFCLILLYLYLIFNSFISIDFNKGLARNLGFIRFIILFLAFNYFFRIEFFFKKVFFVWLIFFLVMLIDIQFEFYFGKNIFGFESKYGERIVSFFKDEPIVGGFVGAFWLILIGFLFDELKGKYKSLILILSLFFLLSIFFTGERSNTIKAILSLIIFSFFLKEYSLKAKLLTFSTVLIIFLSILLNSQFLKLRFVDQILVEKKDLNENIYVKLQKSGLEIFKNNPWFGIGNKNFRVITCEDHNNDSKIYIKKFCSTHPHQIYVELLSEHGLLGFLFIMIILYILIFSKIKEIIFSKNYLSIGSFCYLIVTFTPLIPSGAFFSDFVLTLFFINFSIFYGSNPKLNIFNVYNKNQNINFKFFTGR
jgi:O-antigen ligase